MQIQLVQIIAHLRTLKELYEKNLIPEEIDDSKPKVVVNQIQSLINLLK